MLNAYNEALEFLQSNELYTCDSDDSEVRSFDDVYVNDINDEKRAKSKRKEKKIDDDTPSLFD